MKIRLFHTGDWHIGKGRASWGKEVSLARSSAVIDAIYATARRLKADGVIAAGDIFDNKTVLYQELRLLAEKMAEHASEKRGIPTYMIPGNHDGIREGATNLDWLSVLAQEEMPNLHVAITPTLVNIAPGLSLYLVPAEWSENQKWVEKAVRKLPDDESVVFVGHAAVEGSVYDSGVPSDSTLNLSKAGKSKKVLWWAFGDIHTHQRIPTLPRGNGSYSGSPAQMNFGEKLPKGGVLITLSDKSGSWRVASSDFVEIASDDIAPLHTVSSADEEIPDNALLKLGKDVVLPSEKREAIVARVVDDQSHGVGYEKMSKKIAKVIPFDPLLGDPDKITADLRRLMKRAYRGEKTPGFKSAKAGLKTIVREAVSTFRDRIEL